jgi:hypothetical protein
MSDVENEMDELQRKMAAKTREIEALVAAEQKLGDLNTMQSTEYARLQIYVEELIYKWQVANVHPSASNLDTAKTDLSLSVRKLRSKSSPWKCDEAWSYACMSAPGTPSASEP